MTPQYGPPQHAATGEQCEWADPQQPRRALERRIVKHEIPITRDEIGANLVIALARKRQLAHFAPQILRQRGVGVGESLILADETTKLAFERLDASVECGVGRRVHFGGGCNHGKRGKRDAARKPQAWPHFCSSRTSGKTFSCSDSTLSGPICL